MKSILSILLFVCITNSYAQTKDSGEFIAVIGEASGTYVPDMITFHFSISVIEKKQADAVDKLTNQANLFIDKVSNFGIDPKKIELSNYRLEEAIDYLSDKNKSIGYEAAEDFKLELKYSDDNFNSFIDSISNTKFKNLSFTYEQTFSDSLSNKIRNELIQKASDNAFEIASILAKSRLLELGDIYSIEYTRNLANLYGVLYIPPSPPMVMSEMSTESMKRPQISRRISLTGIEKMQQVRLVIRIK